MIHLLRRVVLAPLMIVLTVLVVTTLPVWLLVAAALSPVAQGRMRPLRLLWIAVLHMVLESLILIASRGDERHALTAEDDRLPILVLEPVAS